MDEMQEYIKKHKDYFKELATISYDGYRNSVIFFKDLEEKVNGEICFARLYGQMEGKKKCMSYILRLPYNKKEDKIGEHLKYLNYDNILKDIQNIVSDVYDVTVYLTGYKNIKVITFANKVELSFKLDYAITLVMFCILRSMDAEYKSKWVDKTYYNQDKVPQNLVEEIYEISERTNGYSGHDINDDLASFFSNKKEEKFLRKVSASFIGVINKTFGKDGIFIKHREEYIKSFDKTLANPRNYGHVMQTDCYNTIQTTTNKFLLEEKL